MNSIFSKVHEPCYGDVRAVHSDVADARQESGRCRCRLFQGVGAAAAGAATVKAADEAAVKAADDSHHEINDYAAEAESIQPTGYTLETTQVRHGYTPLCLLARVALRLA